MAIQVKNHVLTNGRGEGGDLVIPSAVDGAAIEAIGMTAFFANARLTGVTIPRGVKRIGDCAFCGCENMRAVTLPEGLQTIGASAFLGCSSLRSVVIPESVDRIINETFRNCTSLARIVIPESVTSIGEKAFSGCASLEHIVIPKSVKKIGTLAFENCTSLKSIVFSGETEMWEDILTGCSALESVELSSCKNVMPRIHAPNTLKRVSVRAKHLYGMWNWLRDLFAENPNLREFVVPADAEIDDDHSRKFPPHCRIIRR